MTAPGWWTRVAERVHGLSDRDRRALLLGALVLGPALGWVAVGRPYLRTLHDLQDRLAAERALLEREKAALQQAPTLPARLEQAQAALEQWSARLVESPSLAMAEAEVSSMLEEVARDSRVLLQEIGAVTIPPDAVPPAGLEPFRLSVQGESDFEGVLRFLNGIEENPLLLRTVGLSMEPVRVTGGGGGRGGGPPPPPRGTMTFVVIVEAYVPSDEAGAGT